MGWRTNQEGEKGGREGTLGGEKGPGGERERGRVGEGTRWWLYHGAPTESTAGPALVGGVWATSSGLCGVGTRGLR